MGTGVGSAAMLVDVAGGASVGGLVKVGDAGPRSHAPTSRPSRYMTSMGFSRGLWGRLAAVERTVQDTDIVTLQQHEKQGEIGRRSTSVTLLAMTTCRVGPMTGEARDKL